jgi:hypothetical protein
LSPGVFRLLQQNRREQERESVVENGTTVGPSKLTQKEAMEIKPFSVAVLFFSLSAGAHLMAAQPCRETN